MDVWSWGSPLGLGVFIVAIATTITLLAGALRLLSGMPMPRNGRRR